jgi:RHS repeat-associated protein
LQAYAGDTYVFDAENRLTTVAGVTYSYDGDGRRVKKSNGTLYWYGTNALDPVMETDLSGGNASEFIFFNGRRAARRDAAGAISYFFADHLGSSRVVTNATGTIVEDSDFYPFGGERIIVNNDPNPYKFTGKERDSESGLDYFIARHYSSGLGRFLQPDEFTGGPVDTFSSSDPLPPGPLPYGDITNPQSLNKYSYTWNNPLRYTDPDGHFIDTLIDIGSVVYSASAVVADVITGSDQLGTDLKALGGDLVGVAVPGLTGVGAAIRAANKVDNVVDAARAVDKVSDATKAANKADSAADAAKVKPDVVTSSGQRADAHGHKLGPSGKPQINKVQHPTKKEAKDAARAEGQAAPVKHPSPKKGKPHFHATDKKGKKKPASTHHEYPD